MNSNNNQFNNNNNNNNMNQETTTTTGDESIQGQPPIQQQPIQQAIPDENQIVQYIPTTTTTLDRGTLSMVKSTSNEYQNLDFSDNHKAVVYGTQCSSREISRRAHLLSTAPPKDKLKNRPIANGKKTEYLPWSYMLQMLYLVFGYSNVLMSSKMTQHVEATASTLGNVMYETTITIRDENRSITDCGGRDYKLGVGLTDLFKSASTDSFRRTAKRFGPAIGLFTSDQKLQPLEPTNIQEELRLNSSNGVQQQYQQLQQQQLQITGPPPIYNNSEFVAASTLLVNKPTAAVKGNLNNTTTTTTTTNNQFKGNTKPVIPPLDKGRQGNNNNSLKPPPPQWNNNPKPSPQQWNNNNNTQVQDEQEEQQGNTDNGPHENEEQIPLEEIQMMDQVIQNHQNQNRNQNQYQNQNRNQYQNWNQNQNRNQNQQQQFGYPDSAKRQKK
jgi:hypothetical protein